MILTPIYYVRERMDGVFVAHLVGAFAARRVVTICGGDYVRGDHGNADLLHAGQPHGTQMCAACAAEIRGLRDALRAGGADGASGDLVRSGGEG